MVCRSGKAAAPMACRSRSIIRGIDDMMRGLILWLLGVPVAAIIVLWLLGFL